MRLADGGTSTVVERDYRELLPLLRHKRDPTHSDVQRLLQRTARRAGDDRRTLSGARRACARSALHGPRAPVAAQWSSSIRASGAVLALASYPWPEIDLYTAKDTIIEPASLLDRARYGLYPPGSTFKLITAAAALNGSAADALPPFMCERLEDGRVGARVRGIGRPIRDDVLDHVPHGVVDLRKGLVVSCNAYFAQLAMHLGPAALAGAAARSRDPGLVIARAPEADVCRMPAMARGKCWRVRCAWLARLARSQPTASSGTLSLVDGGEHAPSSASALAASVGCRVSPRRDERSRDR